jgi:hypothetical protein
MPPIYNIVESLRVDGYVIIPNLVPEPLLQPLREAAARAVIKARDEAQNGWPHVYIRTALVSVLS